MNWNELKPIELSKIKTIDFPEDQYYSIETPKTQICLHHTVSSPSDVTGVIKTWVEDPAHVATHFIITGDGTPYQLYSSRYWAHHLGISSPIFTHQGFPTTEGRNVKLNQESIGFEICNWGYLTKGTDGKFRAAYGNVVDVPVQEYPNLFRGQRYFEKYTDAQIQTVGELLLYFNVKFGIPLDYNESMWDMSKDALSGKSAVWAHCSFHPEKSDVHPQPEMIAMLKSLKK